MKQQLENIEKRFEKLQDAQNIKIMKANIDGYVYFASSNGVIQIPYSRIAVLEKGEKDDIVIVNNICKVTFANENMFSDAQRYKKGFENYQIQCEVSDVELEEDFKRPVVNFF